MVSVSAELVGSNIAKYRTVAGLTQAQLAERIGVSIPFLSRMERGQKLMKLQTLCAIAQALNVSYDALLCEDSPSVHIENIKVILTDQPIEYLEGIERIIRICTEEFVARTRSPITTKERESPLGGAFSAPQ